MKYLFVGVIAGFLLVSGCTESIPAKPKNSISTGSSSEDQQPFNQTSTAKLTAPSTFAFSNQSKLILQINLPQLVNQKTLITICFPNELDVINRNNCILKTTMSNGEFSVELDLAAHKNTLLLEIRKRSNIENVQIYSWSRDQGMLWQVNNTLL